MYSKVHHQLHRSSTANIITPKNEEDEEDEQRLKFSRSLPLSYRYYEYDEGHFPEFLLELDQESLLAATSHDSSSSHFHLHLNGLLFDFFDTTRQACAACASLLSSLNHVRSHHRSIHHLLAKLSTSRQNSPFSTFSQLSSHLELDNPLSPKNLSHFHLIHSRYPALIQGLTTANQKIARRLKIVRLTKKASGIAIITLYAAVVVTAVVIASHAAVAVAAVPIAAASSSGLRGLTRRLKGWKRLERVKGRIDSAAKGAYIVGRDLDTLSRMVRRVHDEVEHGRDVGRMVVRNREWGMVREVVKEMEGRGGEVGLGLEEKLEELEEHVYLCLITINRSRRLVAQDMMEPQDASIIA